MDTTVALLNESGRWLVTQLGRMSVELFVLAGIVLVALYVLRVKSPALRHLFWGLLLAKPVVTFLVASPVSLYAVFWPSTPEVLYTPPPVVVQSEPVPAPVIVAMPQQTTAPAVVSLPEAPSLWRQIDRYGITSMLWILAASVLGLRLLLGCAYVAFLRSTAMIQREGPLLRLLDEAYGALKLLRRVRIAVTRVAHGPVLAGIFHPVILLPENMAGELTPSQLKLVIIHELAHARRWDNLVLFVQRLAEIFFFFHPVVWFCGWMMRREAEAACDDIVVAAYGDGEVAGAAAYADSLTRVAEMKCGITHRLLVNTFAAAESNFHRRIRRILSGHRTRMTLWLSMAAGAALVLIGALGLPTVRSAQNDSGVGQTIVAMNGRAQLPGGASAEIVGIGFNSDSEKLWWDLQGKVLPQAPCACFSNALPGTYEIVVSLTGRDNLLARGATPEIWDFSVEHASGGQWGVVEDATGQNRCLRAAEFRPEGEKATEMDVRLGIALGPWETKGITRTGGNTISEPLNTGHFTMTAPVEDDGKILVETTFPRKLDEVAAHRVVAILNDGAAVNGSEMTHGGFTFLRARADNIITCASIEDIDHIEFQICDYQWVEFQHVSLSGTTPLTIGDALPSDPLQTANVTSSAAAPVSGPLIVAPTVGNLDEKTKAAWQSQGITSDAAIFEKLQDVTLDTIRKRLDSASLQHVTVRKLANGRIALDLPSGKEGERIVQIALQPGQVSFCAAASMDETLEVLTNAEKDPRFQGRIEPWIDRTANVGYVRVAADQRDTAKAVLGELESVLPDKKRFMLGSRLDPNALYLVDFNTAMTNVKVQTAVAAPDNNDPGRSMVLITLSDEDAQRFGELTQSLIGKSLALLVDWEIQTVPTVRSRITNGIQIVGNYTPEETGDLAARISGPEYLVPLIVLSDPTATPGTPRPAESENATATLEERTYENINEAVFERTKTHLLPVYDPNTGEELSTLSYDKTSSRLTVRNLSDNFAWFDTLLSQLGVPKKIKTSSSASSQLASCANNLKQCGLILKLFANEAPKQMAPPLSPLPGCLMWHKEAVYPEYLTDPTILICPTEEEKCQEANGMEKPEDKMNFCFGNSSYWYLGYALPDEKTALAFIQAYRRQIENAGDFTADLKDTEGTPIPIRRLQEGVERYFITDINDPAGAAKVQSNLPVFIERPGHHDNQINVLFMDGHVERLSYPGDFPASQWFIEALRSLDALRERGERVRLSINETASPAPPTVQKEYDLLSIAAHTTPDGGYTHLVVFEPAGNFNPRTPSELLDVFNGVCKVKTGYFRTKAQEHKLVGSICTDAPEALKESLASELRLKWIESVPLTADLFEEHEAHRQESLDTQSEGRYTHLVVFEPAGDFNPGTPRELLDVFNRICKVRTGYLRTKAQDGRLLGSICTDAPEEIRKSFETEPRLKFVESVPLTTELFAQHVASEQESLPVSEAVNAAPDDGSAR